MAASKKVFQLPKPKKLGDGDRVRRPSVYGEGGREVGGEARRAKMAKPVFKPKKTLPPPPAIMDDMPEPGGHPKSLTDNATAKGYKLPNGNPIERMRARLAVRGIAPDLGESEEQKSTDSVDDLFGETVVVERPTRSLREMTDALQALRKRLPILKTARTIATMANEPESENVTLTPKENEASFPKESEASDERTKHDAREPDASAKGRTEERGTEWNLEQADERGARSRATSNATGSESVRASDARLNTTAEETAEEVTGNPPLAYEPLGDSSRLAYGETIDILCACGEFWDHRGYEAASDKALARWREEHKDHGGLEEERVYESSTRRGEARNQGTTVTSAQAIEAGSEAEIPYAGKTEGAGSYLYLERTEAELEEGKEPESSTEAAEEVTHCEHGKDMRIPCADCLAEKEAAQPKRPENYPSSSKGPQSKTATRMMGIQALPHQRGESVSTPVLDPRAYGAGTIEGVSAEAAASKTNQSKEGSGSTTGRERGEGQLAPSPVPDVQQGKPESTAPGQRPPSWPTPDFQADLGNVVPASAPTSFISPSTGNSPVPSGYSPSPVTPSTESISVSESTPAHVHLPMVTEKDRDITEYSERQELEVAEMLSSSALVCDNCSITQQCKKFKEHHTCYFEQIDDGLSTRDLRNIIPAMEVIADLQKRRALRAARVEATTGQLDVNTTRQLEVAANAAERVMRLKAPQIQSSSRSVAVISQGGQAQGGGLLAKLMAGITGTNVQEGGAIVMNEFISGPSPENRPHSLPQDERLPLGGEIVPSEEQGVSGASSWVRRPMEEK